MTAYTEPLIDPNEVSEIFGKCESSGGDVEAEGIALVRFKGDQLRAYEAQIRTMLSDLPPEFRVEAEGGGGGYSFLNGCTDRNGNQWTGLQMVVERLFLLGMGIGCVKSILPRDLWVVLPGGVPYYVVQLDNAA